MNRGHQASSRCLDQFSHFSTHSKLTTIKTVILRFLNFVLVSWLKSSEKRAICSRDYWLLGSGLNFNNVWLQDVVGLPISLLSGTTHFIPSFSSDTNSMSDHRQEAKSEPQSSEVFRNVLFTHIGKGKCQEATSMTKV